MARKAPRQNRSDAFAANAVYLVSTYYVSRHSQQHPEMCDVPTAKTKKLRHKGIINGAGSHVCAVIPKSVLLLLYKSFSSVGE